MRTNWPLLATLLAALSVASFFSGCAPMPNPPDVGAWADDSLGARHAIKLEWNEQPDDAQPRAAGALTLKDALAEGLTHSSDIQAALARVERAFAESHQARLLPNPIITLALRFPESKGDPIIEAGLAANLMAALQAPWQASAADQRLRVASQDALTIVLDTAAALELRYVEAQALDTIIPVLEARRRLAAQLSELAQSRLRGGEGTRLDADTAESELVGLDIELEEQQTARRRSRLQLARLIGRPSDRADWHLDALEYKRRAPGDEGAWITAALGNRPELAAKRWELAALGVEDRLTRLALFEGTEPGVAAERDGDWSIGPTLAMPLPIFDWGQAKRDAVHAKRVETMHLLTKVRRGVIEEVRVAWSEYASSQATLDRVEKTLMPLLDRRRSDAEALFRGGHSDVVPIVLADQDLHSAQAKRIELQRKTAEALVRLNRAAGGEARAPASPAANSPTQP